MKKVKITLVPGSSGKKFYLFPSAEALYMWTCSLEKGETLAVPDIEEIVLEPGGFMEVELRGFDYAWDGPGFKRFDKVRLGLAQQPKNASGMLVTIHSGWVSAGLMPMRPYNDADISVTTLASEDCRIDLPVLFKDEVLDESIDIQVEEDDEKR